MGSKRDFIRAISEGSGLKKSTVRNLLNNGWTYSTGVKTVRQWIGPESKFVNPPTVGPKGPAGNSGVAS